MAFSHYLQILDEQKAYIDKIEAEFNNLCDRINLETTKKLSSLGKNNSEKRKKILTEHEEKLAEALLNLKEKITANQKGTNQKLENISEKDDQQNLSKLEKELEDIKI